MSDLSGKFTLKDGSLSFSDLSFGLPGALVRLHGSYGLRSEAIALRRHAADGRDDFGGGRRRRQGVLSEGRRSRSSARRARARSCRSRSAARGTSRSSGSMSGKSSSRNERKGERWPRQRKAVRSREVRRGVAEDPDAGAVSGAAPSRHGAPGVVRAAQGASRGHVLVRRLRAAAVRGRSQVRERHRLAELLRAARRRRRLDGRRQPVHAAHRGPLQPLRRTPRPRLRGRPAADRSALLHQRRRAELRAGAGRYCKGVA